MTAALGDHGEDTVAAVERAILAYGERRSVDIGAILADGIPPVEYMPGALARRMVYAVGVTGFSGHPESGKSSPR